MVRRLRLVRKGLEEVPVEEIVSKEGGEVEVLELRRNRIRQLQGLEVLLRMSLRYSLKCLDLSCNVLEVLPCEIHLFVNIEVLVVDHNCLKKLPRELGQMKNLRELSAKHNQLCELPSELSTLTSLNYMNVADNRIRRFPISFAALENVRTVVYQNNPLIYPPNFVLEKGWSAVRIYLKNPFKYRRSFSTPTFSADLSPIPRITENLCLPQLRNAMQTVLGEETTREHFFRFLYKEHCLENLCFIEDVQAFLEQKDELQAEDFFNEGKLLYNKYIQPDQPSQVNLPSQILENFSQTFLNDQPPERKTKLKLSNLFAKAYESIFQLLALSSFPRFLLFLQTKL